jgi:hypothetical protein
MSETPEVVWFILGVIGIPLLLMMFIGFDDVGGTG